jgi:hypothetical protein
MCFQINNKETYILRMYVIFLCSSVIFSAKDVQIGQQQNKINNDNYGKLEVSVGFTNQDAMNTLGGVNVQIYTFLTQELYEGKWSAPRSGRSTRRKSPITPLNDDNNNNNNYYYCFTSKFICGGL